MALDSSLILFPTPEGGLNVLTALFSRKRQYDIDKTSRWTIVIFGSQQDAEQLLS
jgi:hypothetical protein